MEEHFLGGLGVAEWSGVRGENDVNYFFGVGCWCCLIRKTNWEWRAKGGVGGGARWSWEDGCGGEAGGVS